MTGRLEAGIDVSRYIEGFYAVYAYVRIGRRTWYVQRTRSSGFLHRTGIRSRLILYVGPVWGLDCGTWRTA